MKITGFHADLQVEILKAVFAKKGYKFFDGSKSYNLNIVGVRNSVSKSNAFDDMLWAIQRNKSLEWELYSYRITTDPGSYWLKNPENVKGTAILVPGQYSSYQIDKHQGKYEAICQRRAPVKVWRDGDKDDVLDWESVLIDDEGMFGINIHKSSSTGESQTVDKWSAGCQVFKNLGEFEEFMSLCRKSAEVFGNKFTYTLLERKDLLV